MPVALSDIFGTAGATAGYALIVVGAFVATRFGARSDASLAVWLALSSAGAIYSWSYEVPLLLVPIVIRASLLVARRGARALGILFVVAPLLYALAVARHRESFTAVISVLLLVVVVARLWPSRKTA